MHGSRPDLLQLRQLFLAAVIVAGLVGAIAGVIMRAVILLALFGCIGAACAAQAAASDSCTKDCRDYQRACLKAHSQDACKIDYDICIKACRKK